MPISRRKFVVAATTAPFISSCATDLSKYSEESIPELATRLGVGAISYVTLDVGKPSASVTLSGCASNVHVNAETIFQAASLTKPVIAFVVLKLAQSGKIDLNAPVSLYLPEGYIHRQNPFSSKAPVVDLVKPATLARIPLTTLLNHTSGLPNWTSGALSPQFEPGERWQYSGEGYVLLQAVISAVTGQDIESCVTRYVFDPLGMRRSRLRLTEDVRGQLVNGALRLGLDRRREFKEPNAAASLYTTSGDYAMLLEALLSDETLLPLTLANPIPTAPELGLAWGRGWGIEIAAGGPYLWQWGKNPGYRSFAMMSASSKDGFVLFTNSERGMPLAAALARATIPAEHGVFRFHMLA
ncbi:serine hydrolase domain-containing protein [Noviherbaspirillum sp. CPCC 100848]|uniref:Serine hydrolase domain-containing protein n=1 Tax=Noviherbaspirillum album TaxID=3080276 RepID=A0ABU6JKJ3_9BURK|nr:serine hydrolase domain-containing protein [Noviherbaspirillum sp. CPCC 100848]MEC4723807.1 serine hydrolase domain-containing protein [Noviherbaspirillum sp. CPCC 100848]